MDAIKGLLHAAVISALLWMMIVLMFACADKAFAQTNPRDQLSGEFRGLKTTLVYQNGLQLVAVPYVAKLGRLKRDTVCTPITSVNAATLAAIPDVGLAAEHWWLSFEMLMICQREYAVLVDRIKREETRLGRCLIDNPACSPYAVLIRSIRDYWVPFNIVNEYGPQNKDRYLAHFDAGISGVKVTYDNIQGAKAYLAQLMVTR